MNQPEGERADRIAPPAGDSRRRSGDSPKRRFRSSSRAFCGFAALVALLTLGISGCGSTGSNSYITGITVSPSASVASGDTVTLTVAVSDSTTYKSATWSADGGTLSVTTGLTVEWIAPTITAGEDFNLTVTVQQTTGLKSKQTVKIHVSASSSAATGATITSVTSSAATVQAGGTITATVAVQTQSSVVSVDWTADAGTLVTNTGYSVQWRAPATIAADQVATLTVTTLGTSGDLHTATVKIQMLASGGSTSGARITGASTSAASVSPGGTVTATVTVSDQTQVSSVTWKADAGSLVSDTGYSVQWIAPSVIATDQVATLTVTTLGVGGDSHTAQVKIQMLTGGGTNSGARITGASTSAASVSPGGTITATVTVSDSSQVLSVNWTSDIGDFVSSQGLSVTWIAPSTVTANQWATLTATSHSLYGDTFTAQVKVLITGSTTSAGSLINKITLTSGSLTAGQSTTITVDYKDTSTLQTIKWTADGGTLSSQVGSVVTWTAPTVTTTTVFTLTVTVVDTSGQTDTEQVEIVAHT